MRDCGTCSGAHAGTREARRVEGACAALLALLLVFASVFPSLAFAADTAQGGGSSASSAQAGDSVSSSASPSGFTGAYSAKLVADGKKVDVADKTVKVTKKDKLVALAKSGGVLSVDGGKLLKTGSGTDAEACGLYGVNAAALATGKKSRIVLSGGTVSTKSDDSSGLFATASATAFANGTSLETLGSRSDGLAATSGGKVVANGVAVKTEGAESTAVCTGEGASASVANSSLSTAKESAPVLDSAGVAELDNVEGVADESGIARVRGKAQVLLSNSTFSSAQAASGGELASSSVLIGNDDALETGDGSESAALFQATNSALSSELQAGALFGVTNGRARVVLADTVLAFDSEHVNLLTVTGNDEGMGTAGKNGGMATFTGRRERLSGNVTVDTISSLDFYLLAGTTWKGSAQIVPNKAGEASGDSLNVSIDATSRWTVTADSKVTNLNIESGGALVDANGDAVKITDKDGNTLVDGASDVKVSVQGAFTTTVNATDINEPASSTVSREAFDETFGTQTAFGENGESLTSDELRVRELVAYITAWFENL